MSTLRADFLAAGRTLANRRRDFVEWHRGRSPFALWAIDVDRPRLRERVAMAARALDGLLLADYRRQPHITLALCGFPQTAPGADDEFGAAALAAQIDALRAASVGAFDITIGGLSSFTSAPFLEVGDPDGGIARLRALLAGSVFDLPAQAYVPHVTVGLYADAWPSAAVAARLAAGDGWPLWRERIARVSLMAYCPRAIGGELRRIAEVDLADGGLRLHDAADFALAAVLATAPAQP